MTTAAELLKQGLTQELWQKYCGFIDLTLEEFMGIQERLLMEQIQWFGQCELGRKLMGNPLPASVAEFRQRVPLTTYADYAPHFLERREDVLPEPPLFWMRTSGRSGEYPCKWAPIFRKVWDTKRDEAVMTPLIFASCRRRGDFVLSEGDTIPYCMAPPPYGFGMLVQGAVEEFPFVLLPSQEKALQMRFQERVEEAFNLAFREGIDVFLGLASILVKVGQQFSEKSEKTSKFSLGLLHPKALFRLARGIIRSRLAGRPMYPKDLWRVKAIVTGGTDTSIYREKIAEYWGQEPVEMYGSTEGFLVAVQTWDRAGMIFLPDMNFLEFIPEAEHLRSKSDPNDQPRTVLLDEVEPGEKYEIVLTNFGGTFLRYRIGDMIRITARRNERLGIDIPQMQFEARCDDIIDLAGFTRMTEKVIWQAIEDAGLPYEDWTVRKEVEGEHSTLHLYIELKGEGMSREAVRDAVHGHLKALDPDYRDIEAMLGYRPLRVTLLSTGTFHRYLLDRQAAGAELAHFKPPHVMASDEAIGRLLRMSSASA